VLQQMQKIYLNCTRIHKDYNFTCSSVLSMSGSGTAPSQASDHVLSQSPVICFQKNIVSFVLVIAFSFVSMATNILEFSMFFFNCLMFSKK